VTRSHAAIYRLAAGPTAAHLPILHLRHGFSSSPRPRPFENLRGLSTRPSAVTVHIEQHLDPLILPLRAFSRVLRCGNDAHRRTDAVRPPRNVPPPVPPPSPGPSLRRALPIPVPLPFPRESVTFLARGSPKSPYSGWRLSSPADRAERVHRQLGIQI